MKINGIQEKSIEYDDSDDIDISENIGSANLCNKLPNWLNVVAMPSNKLRMYKKT